MTPTGESDSFPTAINAMVAAFEKVGWLKKAPSGCRPHQQPSQECFFRTVIDAHHAGSTFGIGGQQFVLSQRGFRRVAALVQLGVTLRGQFCNWQTGVEAWLGRRLFLSHATHLNASAKYTAIVSSRMGRGQRHVPDWPQRVEAALASSRRLSHRILTVPGTATHNVVETAAKLTGLAAVELVLPDSDSVEQWLTEKLVDPHLVDGCATQVMVSPALDIAALDITGLDIARIDIADAAIELHSTPLRDRAAISLADRVLSMSARSGGAIETLLRARAGDDRFPTGTTYIARRKGEGDSKKSSGQAELLDSGVIGWLIGQRSSVQATSPTFRSCETSGVGLQAAMPMPKSWASIELESWPFLSHCTRGSSGPRPLESEEAFRRRVWIEGFEGAHPLSTLGMILSSGTLRCNDTLYRSSRPVVSFSQNPLPSLLASRTFQPHLGRWDWEPYGIMIRRSALEQQGARPVIYGDDALYLTLSDDEQAYFQPSSRRGSKRDWSQEREWRVVGDVHLCEIGHNDAIVFVANRREAIALSRKVRWPVVWTED